MGVDMMYRCHSCSYEDRLELEKMGLQEEIFEMERKIRKLNIDIYNAKLRINKINAELKVI